MMAAPRAGSQMLDRIRAGSDIVLGPSHQFDQSRLKTETHQLQNPDQRDFIPVADRPVEELTLELEDMALQLTLLRKDLAEAQEALSHAQADAKTQRDSLEEEISDFVERLVDRDKRIIALNHQVQQMKAAPKPDPSQDRLIENLTHLRDENKKRAVRLRRQLDQAQEALAQQRAEIARMRHQHQADIAEISNAYLSSTSWRISAPVRALGRLLRPRG